MSKPLVIFHSNCLDGAAAALAAWLKFGDDAEYRPASYGDKAPTDEEVRGRDVYILDFSYPRAELVRMWNAQKDLGSQHDTSDYRPPPGGTLRVLDHHATAQADLAGLPFCTFNMNKSGAVLAWEHFTHHPIAEAPLVTPELFAYVQDRDLWRWELPHSREVSAALAASGALTDFRKLIPIYEGWDLWREEYDKEKHFLVADGAAILRAERLQVERIAATAEEVEIEYQLFKQVSDEGTCVVLSDRRVRALGATSAVLQSEVGEALALESARRGRDAVGVVYYRDGAAGKWRVSLRSRDNEITRGPREPIPAPDVSAVAKSFGGGGHAKAAGFECEELPWSSATPSVIGPRIPK